MNRFEWEKEMLADRRLGSSDVLVAMILGARMDTEACVCWPEIGYLAEATRMAERTVKRSIKRLSEFGWIEVERRYRNGQQVSNLYRAAVPEEGSHESTRGGDTDDIDTKGGVSCVTPRGGPGVTPRGGPGVTPIHNHCSTNEQPSIDEPRLFDEPTRAPKPPDPKPEPKRRRADHGLDGFDEFWARYPRRIGKAAARAAWRHTTPDERPLIRRALDLYLAELVVRPRPPGFVKHPSTFLNGAWQDHYEPESTALERPFEEWDIDALYEFWTAELNESPITWSHLMNRGYERNMFDDEPGRARYMGAIVRERAGL